MIRIPIPTLTEERRKELVKLSHKLAEEGRVRVRQVRRDANERAQEEEKEGDVSEDDAKRLTDQVQKLTDTLHRADRRPAQEEESRGDGGLTGRPGPRPRAASGPRSATVSAVSTRSRAAGLAHRPRRTSRATSRSSWTATAAGRRARGVPAR